MLLLAFSSVVAHADGDTNACKFGTYKQMLNGECECTKHFPKKEIPKIVPLRKGQRLVSVCRFVKSQQAGLDEGPSGLFNFETNENVSGVIHYSVGPAGDFSFSTKAGDLDRWLESESEGLDEYNKLKARNLNLLDGSFAKSKLRIKEYYIQYDSGAVVRSGITNYDVIKIEKYQSLASAGN